jgi:L-fucose isomerase-like protein
MKHQLIMHRLMEPGKNPNITVGTLEGTLCPGPATVFRFNHNMRGESRAYVAEGHVIDADPASFGGIGIIGCPGFARFYRHVLLEHMFPHHAAVGFRHAGSVLFDAARLLGIAVDAPLPKGVLYPGENPFSA